MVFKKKSKVKRKYHTCNGVSAILEKDADDAAQLTNSKTETTALVIEHEAVPIAGTRSRSPCFKDFGNANVGPLSHQRRLMRD